MVKLNPIIIKHLKSYCNEDPDIPDSLEDLITKLLEIEALSKDDRGGVDKLYDQAFEKFVKDDHLVKWSKNYGT